MTYDEFIRELFAEPPSGEGAIWKEQRLGQRVFNRAHDLRRDLVSPLIGSDVDPFYDDAKIPAFLLTIRKNW